AVAIVDIKIIAFVEVIGNIHVRPTVLVDVPYRDAEPETDHASVNSGLFTHVNKTVSFVAIQFVPAQLVTDMSEVAITQCRDRAIGVVQDVTIEVTILVIVEECRMCGKAMVRKAVLSCLFREGQITVIDEELVFLIAAVDVAGVGDVDVEETIRIYVGNADPG